MIFTGTANIFHSQALRIFGGLWLLVMTVIVYGYSGLLISCLTIPEMTKPIETLEDVAASKDVTLHINPDGLAGFGHAVMVRKWLIKYIILIPIVYRSELNL